MAAAASTVRSLPSLSLSSLIPRTHARRRRQRHVRAALRARRSRPARPGPQLRHRRALRPLNAHTYTDTYTYTDSATARADGTVRCILDSMSVV